MKVYLLRHGDYATSGPDHIDTLTAKGRSEITQLANFIKLLNIKVGAVYHSGRHRALETAEILAPAMNCANISIHQGLNPLDEVSNFAQDLRSFDQDLLVVSHLPFLARLVGSLVVNDDNKDLVNFNTGTFVVLESVNHSRYIIHWVIQASLLLLAT